MKKGNDTYKKVKGMKKSNQRFQVLLIVMTLLISACNANKKKDTQTNLNPEQAKALAKEAWHFGLPLVMFEKQIDYSTHVTRADKTRAPFNFSGKINKIHIPYLD